jgi:hypothetical protein
MKYKPSVLAAAQIFIGFQLQFDILMRNTKAGGKAYALLDLNDTTSRDMIGQIANAFRTWNSILTDLPGIEDVSKIVLFSDHILKRQLDLH